MNGLVNWACAACGRTEWPHKARGYCSRCYHWWRRYGQPRPVTTDLRGTRRPCQLCGRLTKPLKRGLCHTHYMAWWRRARVIA